MEGETSAMRLEVSRHRDARPALRGAVSRACAAVAGSSLLVIALSGAAGAGFVGPHAASGPPRYVSLGDSYTAAPLVPDQTGSPVVCLRSRHNYPSLVAAATSAATFSYVSCQGATTVNMTDLQSGPLGTKPPQNNTLSA